MKSSPNPFISFITEIFRVHSRFRHLFQDSAGSTGLTRIQNMVLGTVIESNQAQTVAQLGRRLGHPRQVIQRTTNELISRGILAMKDNPADKRARLVVATALGLELKATADEWAELTSAELLSDLQPGLCETTTANLEVLRGAIDRYIDLHGRGDDARSG